MSERNDVPLKRTYKYKCLETCCNAVVDDKKWHRHCQTKHRYKTASHLLVKRAIVEVRIGKGAWMPYRETSTATSSSTVGYCHSSMTSQDNASAHGIASPNAGSSRPSIETEFTCGSVDASLDTSISTSFIADDCRSSALPAAISSSSDDYCRSSVTPQKDASACSTSPDAGSSRSSTESELTCGSVPSVDASLDASINAAFIADQCSQSSATVQPESAVVISGCHQRSIHDAKLELGMVSAAHGTDNFTISDAMPLANVEVSSIKADSQDPAFFITKRIDAKMINLLVNDAAFQPTDCTPITQTKSVQASWFHRRLPDNSIQHRPWLSYSSSLKALFCITCIAFGGPTASPMWTSNGCSDWAHVTRNIERHEMSDEHLKCEISRLQWLAKKRLVDCFGTQRDTWNACVERNRRVACVMIDAVKYLERNKWLYAATLLLTVNLTTCLHCWRNMSQQQVLTCKCCKRKHTTRLNVIY